MLSKADPGSHDCVLISGASRGLGAALAMELARDGVVLILLGRDSAALEETVRRCRSKGATCRPAVCDISDGAALRTLAAQLELEGLFPDLIVSNAGVLQGRRESEVVEAGDVATRLFHVNLFGAITLVSLFLPRMIARSRGHILFVSSLAALSPLADAVSYSASKAGLLSYGLALRASLAGSGVAVQIACPGYIKTAMGQRHIGARPGEYTAEQAARMVLRGVRRGRAMFGFPFLLFHLARLSQLAPEWMQRCAVARLRFHVDPEDGG